MNTLSWRKPFVLVLLLLVSFLLVTAVLAAPPLSENLLENNEDTLTYISPTSEGAVDGIPFTPGDILSVDAAGNWAMVFDATDLGLSTTADLRGFTFLGDGILMAFKQTLSLPGIGGLTTPWDVVRFIPTQLGPDTAGSFEFFFDGSDVGLSASGEEIDALHIEGDTLYFSTYGLFSLPGGVTGDDEDIPAFTFTANGLDTSGTWSLFLDTSTLDPALAAEDMASLWLDESMEPTFSLERDFRCNGTPVYQRDLLHYNGVCSIVWHAPDYGFPSHVSGVHIAAAPLDPAAQDRAALVALYQSTDGDNWTDNTNWLTGDHCDWFRVTCDGDGRVETLVLFDNLLSGNIPGELGNLGKMILLVLSDNQLSGSIPIEIGNLSNLLNLDLSENQLKGTIPPELGNLGKLRYLKLFDNQLSGAIPPELGNLSSMDGLDLSSNQLNGPIPPELGGLGSKYGLFDLYLHDNQLSGPIPDEFPLPVGHLDLSNNELTCWESESVLNGAYDIWSSWDYPAPGDSVCGVPASSRESEREALIALYESTDGDNWTTNTNWLDPAVHQCDWYGVDCLYNDGHVSHLLLDGNNLNGTLLTNLQDLSYLETLRLQDNQLTCWETQGVLDWALAIGGTWDYPNPGEEVCDGEVERAILVTLYESTDGDNWTTNTDWLSTTVNHCDWFGVTCDGDGRVERLELDHNNLSGPLPPEMGNLGFLSYLNLDGNPLTGTLPPEWGGMTSLSFLRMGGSGLTGSIPPEWGDLSNLTDLLLYNNQLNGSIPPELGNLSNLDFLSLPENQLTGSIPPELGDLNNLGSLHLNDNQLDGPIPSELGNLGSLTSLELQDNSLLCWETQTLLNWALALPGGVWDYPNPGEVVCEAPGVLTYISPTAASSVDGIPFTKADILSVDAAGNWAMVFDASDLGIAGDVRGFTFLGGDILMAFKNTLSLPGLGALATPWDVVRFKPTSLGPDTAGSFEFYFDGSDVGLSASGEKIDALHIEDGTLYFSTYGGFSLPGGVSGHDEDIPAFTPTATGNNTAGTWSLFLDTSTLDPALAPKDMAALWLDESMEPIFNLERDFRCDGTPVYQRDLLHYNGTCSIVWHAPDYGFPVHVSGLHIGP